MTYHERFNNTLAIWTAFGGRGNLILPIPTLKWEKRYYHHFGYPQTGSATRIDVFDNGQAQIAVYRAQNPRMSYFNHQTGQWTIVDVPWWNHGIPEILWAGDGVFLARIVGLANIIASFDGITWHNAGFCRGAQNHMETGAYDITRNVGVVSWWWYKSPVYYSFDSLTERTEWTLTGSDGNSVPIFKYLTAHKGTFVGVVGGDKSIAVASSASPWAWTTTIPEDPLDHRYMYIRSVNNKLFVHRFRYHGSPGNFSVNLCVLNDSATQLIETNLSHYGDLADNRAPNPQNIVWMKDWGKYALFTQNMLYASADGIYWEGVEQPGFSLSPHGNMFGGAIYVPGDGFYVKGNGFVFFGAY